MDINLDRWCGRYISKQCLQTDSNATAKKVSLWKVVPGHPKLWGERKVIQTERQTQSAQGIFPPVAFPIVEISAHFSGRREAEQTSNGNWRRLLLFHPVSFSLFKRTQWRTLPSALLLVRKIQGSLRLLFLLGFPRLFFVSPLKTKHMQIPEAILWQICLLSKL